MIGTDMSPSRSILKQSCSRSLGLWLFSISWRSILADIPTLDHLWLPKTSTGTGYIPFNQSDIRAIPRYLTVGILGSDSLSTCSILACMSGTLRGGSRQFTRVAVAFNLQSHLFLIVKGSQLQTGICQSKALLSIIYGHGIVQTAEILHIPNLPRRNHDSYTLTCSRPSPGASRQ